MVVTGHKNSTSLESYTQGPSSSKRAQMSNIISSYGRAEKKQKCETVTRAVCDDANVQQDIVPIVANVDSQGASVEDDSVVENSVSSATSTDVVQDIVPAVTSTITLSHVTSNRSIDVTPSASLTSLENISAMFSGATFNAPVTINIQFKQ